MLIKWTTPAFRNLKKYTMYLHVTCVALFFSCVTSLHAQTEDKLQFSGFARAVAGYLNEDDAQYLGYENKVSFAEQSLLGLQVDYQISKNFSATAQAIGRTGDDNDSGIEWLYVTYTPTTSLRFKLGRQRTPVFSYSDYLDVGFAYNWVLLPQQVYQQFLFPNFDGLHANYEHIGEDISLSIEAYFGELDRNFIYKGESLNTNVDNILGMVSSLGYEGWTIRASFHQGDADVTQEELSEFSNMLRGLGFIQSADSLLNKGFARFYQLSVFYEDVDYFFRSEASRLRTGLFLAPDTNGYFISGGVNFYPFSFYASFARDTNKYSAAISEIPFGVNQQLDQLAYGYQQITAQVGNNSTVSYSIGGRWDWNENLAFKMQTSLLKERDGFEGIFVNRNSNFDGKAMFYQLALEWVF
ncbi:hypothetical protein [Paraglaciecola chathamensis]|uniref:hypothetical protein n=1 Tax=Paraglaciecola chathamensis TaxID=368405 RepID=UPI0026F8789C|nr:hypothetical protein [Paraglaciecola chathamensis]MDO6559896.1 hypothetical protein [Paraglaciecola chathamensis]